MATITDAANTVAEDTAIGLPPMVTCPFAMAHGMQNNILLHCLREGDLKRFPKVTVGLAEKV